MVREAAQLRPDQITLLLSLRHGEGCVIGTLYCYRGDTLPPMPRWLKLAPVIPPQFAYRAVLFGVVLVILAVLGVRDWLRRASGI